MALWKWRTLSDNRVEVDKGQGFQIPTLADNPYFDKARARTLQWLPLAIEKGKKYGVPPSWILGFVYAESGGKPDAENYCCVGLMAIYYSVHKQSKADMLDPEKNMDYGTSLLAKSRSKGYDLPATASIHVAGGGSQYKPHAGTCCSAMCKPTCPVDKNGKPKCVTHPEFPGGSPWGMCEHMSPRTQDDGAVGYIDRVVRANNTFVEAMGKAVVVPPGPGPLPGVGPQPGPEPARAGFLGTLAPFAIGGLVGFYGAKWLQQTIERRA